jgi:hypothetical protein
LGLNRLLSPWVAPLFEVLILGRHMNIQICVDEMSYLL